MSQRRCFLCGHKIRPGEGYRLGKHAMYSDKMKETHLFCTAGCGNAWMIWHGVHSRWNGIRWSKNRYYDIFTNFVDKFINSQRPLPDDCMQLLEENFWSLV